MWVLTEQNSLLNLDRHARIEVQHQRVIAWFDSDEGYVNLCTCDDEEHGKRIIARLFTAIRSSVRAIEMCDVKHEENPFKTTLWRPFDTAPKDGTEILVYRPDAGVFMASYRPSWNPDNREFNDEERWYANGGAEDIDDDLPTHWMPLPEPPEDGEAS